MLSLQTSSIIVAQASLHSVTFAVFFPFQQANPDQSELTIQHRCCCSISSCSVLLFYLERTWHSWSRVAHVDESDHGQPDEEPAQEAHEVQQVVEVSNEQEEQGQGVLHGAGGRTDFSYLLIIFMFSFHFPNILR